MEALPRELPLTSPLFPCCLIELDGWWMYNNHSQAPAVTNTSMLGAEPAPGGRAEPTLGSKSTSKNMVRLDMSRRPGVATLYGGTRRPSLTGATADKASGDLGRGTAREAARNVANLEHHSEPPQGAPSQTGHEVDLLRPTAEAPAMASPLANCSLSPHALLLAGKLGSQAKPLRALLGHSCAEACVSGQELWLAAVELLGPGTDRKACDAILAAAAAVSPDAALTRSKLPELLRRHAAAARRARSTSRERGGRAFRPIGDRLCASSSIPALASITAAYNPPQQAGKRKTPEPAASVSQQRLRGASGIDNASGSSRLRVSSRLPALASSTAAYNSQQQTPKRDPPQHAASQSQQRPGVAGGPREVLAGHRLRGSSSLPALASMTAAYNLQQQTEKRKPPKQAASVCQQRSGRVDVPKMLSASHRLRASSSLPALASMTAVYKRPLKTAAECQQHLGRVRGPRAKVTGGGEHEDGWGPLWDASGPPSPSSVSNRNVEMLRKRNLAIDERRGEGRLCALDACLRGPCETIGAGLQLSEEERECDKREPESVCACAKQGTEKKRNESACERPGGTGAGCGGATATDTWAKSAAAPDQANEPLAGHRPRGVRSRTSLSGGESGTAAALLPSIGAGRDRKVNARGTFGARGRDGAFRVQEGPGPAAYDGRSDAFLPRLKGYHGFAPPAASRGGSAGLASPTVHYGGSAVRSTTGVPAHSRRKTGLMAGRDGRLEELEERLLALTEERLRQMRTEMGAAEQVQHVGKLGR
jgi:hypothetical protein